MKFYHNLPAVSYVKVNPSAVKLQIHYFYYSVEKRKLTTLKIKNPDIKILKNRKNFQGNSEICVD